MGTGHTDMKSSSSWRRLKADRATSAWEVTEGRPRRWGGEGMGMLGAPPLREEPVVGGNITEGSMRSLTDTGAW